MGKVFDTIDQKLADFIRSQHVFFVGTAPTQDGHINVSPKGLNSLQIVDDTTLIYADLVGSGIETVAHLKDNGRIVLMFCAFEGAPKIVRLHGTGDVIDAEHSEFETIRAMFGEIAGLRSFIRVRCTRISDSCGYGVPRYKFLDNRNQLPDWCDRKGPEGVSEYIRSKNDRSIDGLPGMGVSTDD